MSAYLSYSARNGGGGGGVTSVNGLTGALTLAAGTGISLTPAGNTITIASTGQPTGNYITALTGDGTATGPGSAALTLATVNPNVGTWGTPGETPIFTVNAKGLVTAVAELSIQITESQVTNLVSDLAGKQATGAYITALTGDGTATGPGSTALTLATVNTNTGAFGSASSVATFTVNGKGLTTAAGSTSIQIAESQVTGLVSDLAGKQATGSYITSLTGDITGSGPGAAATTLATVNGNVGSFTNANITVNAKGLITAVSTGSTTPGNNTVTNAILAQAPANTMKGNNTGGTANELDLTVTQISNLIGITTPSASTLAQRNSSSNLAANCMAGSITTTATAGGTTVLTSSTTQTQQFTGTLNQIITLPTVATSVILGQCIYINNRSTGVLTVNSSGGNLVATLYAGMCVLVTCMAVTGTTAAVWDATIVSPIQTAVFNESQASGTDGGTATSGSYLTRVLNTTQKAQGWASLASNQITLQAGTYQVAAYAPYVVGATPAAHKTQFYNVTDAAVAILGCNAYVGALTQDHSFVSGTITIAAAKTFELRHRVGVTVATNGFGVSCGFGDSEIYSVVTITKQ